MKAIEKPPELADESRLVLEAISSPERVQMLAVLRRHKEGLSFSQMAQVFKMNHNTLDRHLKVLTRSTLAWNFFERREGRDHSFYKLSALGEKLLEDLQQDIVLRTFRGKLKSWK